MASHMNSLNAALPGGFDVALIHSGDAWDAVRVPESLGKYVLNLLGEDCGAVIRDPFSSRLYWLIPAAAHLDWAAFPEAAGVRHLGPDCWVTVPGVERRAATGPYWLVPCHDGNLLTDPQALHRALADAMTIWLGARASGEDVRK